MARPNQSIKLLDAVVATGAGSAVEVVGEQLSFYILIATTATVKIETSPDATNWFDTSITAKTASGYFALEECHRFVRANVTAWTAGAVNVWLARPR